MPWTSPESIITFCSAARRSCILQTCPGTERRPEWSAMKPSWLEHTAGQDRLEKLEGDVQQSEWSVQGDTPRQPVSTFCEKIEFPSPPLVWDFPSCQRIVDRFEKALLCPRRGRFEELRCHLVQPGGLHEFDRAQDFVSSVSPLLYECSPEPTQRFGCSSRQARGNGRGGEGRIVVFTRR